MNKSLLSSAEQLVVCVLKIDVDAVSGVIAESATRDPLLKPRTDSPLGMLLGFIRNCAIRAAHQGCTNSALDIVEVLDEVEAVSSKVRWEH